MKKQLHVHTYTVCTVVSFPLVDVCTRTEFCCHSMFYHSKDIAAKTKVFEICSQVKVNKRPMGPHCSSDCSPEKTGNLTVKLLKLPAVFYI